jgi:hypothetical protein
MDPETEPFGYRLSRYIFFEGDMGIFNLCGMIVQEEKVFSAEMENALFYGKYSRILFEQEGTIYATAKLKREKTNPDQGRFIYDSFIPRRTGKVNRKPMPGLQ